MLSLEYLAGFVDADGCVSQNGRGYLTVTIANTHLPLLEEIKAAWGGSTHTRPSGSSTLTLSTVNARRFLEAILPFMIVKRAVAVEGLKLHLAKSGPERDLVVSEITRLNRITSPNSHYERRAI